MIVLKSLRACVAVSLVLGMACWSASLRADEPPVLFVSSFAPGADGAIGAYRLDETSGALELLHRQSDVPHPFFLALSKDGRFLYSIHAENFGGKEPEQAAAYAVEGRTGRLKLLNRRSTYGTASCYLDVAHDGRALLVANYVTGNVAALQILDDGSLGGGAVVYQHAGSSVDPARQTGPHAHCFVVSPDGRFGLAADLGLDQVLCYRLEPGSFGLKPNDPPFARAPAGAGPRHLTFHPNGRQIYVINELKNSVTLFDFDPKSGAMKEQQTISTLPDDFTGTSYCADVKVTSDGRFLFGTNRGHDSIAAYRIGETGRLTLIEIEPSRGKGPQNLLIAGRWLLCANMPGNSLAAFSIDKTTGALEPAGEPIEVRSPSCLQLLR